ncbi:MAG: hypothetical protein HY685_02010 [Chloroflexi bacterium]|nr:hypothetical protein [Chloroflexota bacterium]
MSRYRWGTLLIVLGVLVWVPFVVSLLQGGDPPFFLYLPIHLAAVLTGNYLRRGRETGPVHPTRRWGNILVTLGVLVWVPYFSLKSLGWDPPIYYFLPFHLSGVIPGVFLRYYQNLRDLWRRLAGQRSAQPNP